MSDDRRYDRDPLKPGLSHPVGRTVVDAALEAADVRDAEIRLRSYPAALDLAVAWIQREDREFVIRSEHGIWLYAVPREDKQRARQLVTTALPRLAAWLRAAQAREGTWRFTDHCLRLAHADWEPVWIEDVFDRKDWGWFKIDRDVA